MARPKRIPTCHPERKHFAKGLCQPCYINQYSDKETLRKNAAKRAARWREKHPERKRESSRKQNLRKHGWTELRFNEYLATQQGLCAICGKELTIEHKMSGSEACTDHEHVEPPKPRGLLCGSCNAGLGQFEDNPSLLEKAAEYLRSWA